VVAPLLSASLWLVPGAAHAAGRLTIKASDDSINLGDRVALSGHAWGSPAGAVVRLQRKLGSTWSTIDSERTASGRDYRFVTTPPLGEQEFRVVKPRQAGQARVVSVSRTVTVRWRPTITIERRRGYMASDDVWITWVSGEVAVPPGATAEGLALDLQRLEGGSWSSTGETAIVRSGRYSVPPPCLGRRRSPRSQLQFDRRESGGVAAEHQHHQCGAGA
jgi:hypothetical protein